MSQKIISVILIMLISIGFFILLSMSQKKEIVLESDGNKFAEISKEDVVMRAQLNYIFLIRDDENQIKHSYKIASQHSSHSSSKIYHHEIPIDKFSDNELFALAFNEQLGSAEILNMNYEELKSLISKAKNIEARELITEPKEDDIVGMVEESSLLFVMIGLLLTLLLAVYEFIKRLFNTRINKNKQRLFDLCILGLLIAFLFFGITPDWYSDNKISALIQLILIVFPSYFLFQFVMNECISKEINESYKLLLRFSLLLFGIVFFVITGSEIARIMEFHLFSGSNYTGLANRVRIPFGLGVGFSFALADLLIQIIKSKLETNVNIHQ